ncbi:glutathione hydrolase 1 proenzyme-like, partial [Gigantopelta aegis]|uniref:glutathione hydrolase 1 proenzyme-like n=1 Tax=Gigantopelta aegis TaxID=1735272 RepID=UPI001B88A451
MSADGVYKLDSGKHSMATSSTKLVVILSIVMFLCGIAMLIVGIVLGVRATQTANNAPCVSPDQVVAPTTPPAAPTTEAPGPTPSPSKEGRYRYAGIATDTEICSKVGIDIMARKGGSAVDAAIATNLCVGSVNFESNGLGGGHFMTIYKKSTNESFAVMAREQAPAAATETMYVGLTDYNNNVE